MKILLLLRTLRFLKISQFYYYIRRRYLKPCHVKLTHDVNVNTGVTLKIPATVSGIYVTDNTFKFLNVSITFNEESLIWNNAGASRLWLYNLHYFDYLHETKRSNSNKSTLINSWIHNNPQPLAPGWEAYTVSLRIVNWVFYFTNNPDEVELHWLDSLYEQTLWLESNLELHILANHYFENLKALAFAGVYFSGLDAKRWLNYAVKNIKAQLIEQTLADGGHYERSPMYHSIMLQNLLDLFNLFDNNDLENMQSTTEIIKEHIFKYLYFLQEITMPNDMLPLFNDSATGISLSYKELLLHAEKLLNINLSHQKNTVSTLVKKDDSGLYGYKCDDDMFIIDCGDIGPSYQPGHTHCDLLSYELMLNKQRIIVDTGVYEYEPGYYRMYARSTKAHNTVCIDDIEQSEIWGGFRVGRRAKRKAANIVRDNNLVQFDGSYTGFAGSKSGIVHTRCVNLVLHEVTHSIQSINIKDHVSGTGQHKVRSYIHLHPSITALEVEPGLIMLMQDEINIAKLQIHNNMLYELEESLYFPEFGIKMKNTAISIHYDGVLPCGFLYSIDVIQ